MKMNLKQLRRLIREEIKNISSNEEPNEMTIEVDIVGDEYDFSLTDYLNKVSQQYNIEPKIIDQEKQIVQFTGTESALKSYYVEYNNGDPRDFDIFIV
jgi:phage-related protein